MKNNTLILLALAGIGIYLVTRKKAAPATTNTTPPVTDGSREVTEKAPPATTRPPSYTYTPPRDNRQPFGLPPGTAWIDPGTQGPATMQGIAGYFASGLKGGVIELPYGARWFHQEPTTTKNARMVL